ncbi:unnamed protein product [Cuscuta epithymum]|uniref:Uncharacterized protein n=1 Tax=Cuscuta epithymum TaxID=186058 RepID=A0AAV0EWQ6_9ASTE|nr:unnamed protein product [Cuscuta epithymum]
MVLYMRQKPIFLVSFLIWWSWWGGVVAAEPQTNLVTMGCSIVNVTGVTAFRRNLNATYQKLRAQISNQSSNHHFATGQELKGSSPAFALFQCRNYLAVNDCLACFDRAVIQLRRNCSAVSNGAHIIFDGCFLRYESTTFFDQNTYPANNVVCGNEVKNSTQLASTVQQVLTNLDIVTPRITGFFAATKTPVPNDSRRNSSSNIYAFAQCVETLSQTGCQDCLKIGLRNFQLCLPSSNAKTFDFGCFMRYSTTPFFADNQTIDIYQFLQQGHSSKKKIIIGGVVGGASFILVLLAIFALYRQRSNSSKRVHRGDILAATELKGPINYRYGDLKSATKNFSQENKLGERDSCDVYKGTLENGKVVAIKKLDIGQSKDTEKDFESEVKLISNVHHRNLVRLLGCCSKGQERFLVYEYMQTNVAHLLFGKNKGSQNWMQRYEILLGTARGLAYLHEGFHVCIVHRDIKASNIFLDDDFQAKIGDFGLVRSLPRQESHLITEFSRSMEYTAPEYVMHRQMSEKIDIYSYGVVLLEIISGQKNGVIQNDDGDEFLLQRAWKLYERGMHIELVDKSLDTREYDTKEVEKVIEIGLLCIQASPTARPMMSEIVRMLKRKDLMEQWRPTMPAFVGANSMKPKTEPSASNDSSSSIATLSTTIMSGR